MFFFVLFPLNGTTRSVNFLPSLSLVLSLSYVSNMLYINEEIFFSQFLLSQIVSVHVQTVARAQLMMSTGFVRLDR